MQSTPRRYRFWTGARNRLLVVMSASLIVCGFFYGGLRYLVPHNVQAFEVGLRAVPWTVRGPGLVDATNKVTVTARIQGRLSTVTVQRNDLVTEGQPIAQLQSEDLHNQLIGAQAEAEAAERAIVISRSGQTRAQAVFSKMTADIERKKRLWASGTVSEADFEASQSAFIQAQSDLDSAIVSIKRAEAQSRSAEANVKSIAARLDDARIVSPLNGVVVSRDRNVGDVILPGAAIVQLVDPASIIISARFDESVMGVVAIGQPVAIKFTSEPRRTYQGQVNKIGRQVDQETREFAVEISVNGLPSNWALGQRASVEIAVSSSSDQLVIPQQFVYRVDGLAGVWVAHNSRAQWRFVTLGYRSGPLVDVREGLQPGDIIIAPHDRYPFELVRPRMPRDDKSVSQ